MTAPLDAVVARSSPVVPSTGDGRSRQQAVKSGGIFGGNFLQPKTQNLRDSALIRAFWRVAASTNFFLCFENLAAPHCAAVAAWWQIPGD